MQPEITAGRKLLDAAYKELGYSDGKLLDATDSPETVGAEDWIDNGEWLALAKKVGAEKIFFVKNNPVIVFANHFSTEPEEQRIRFKEIWNMARPVLLFLASPGELAVYDLTSGPSKNLTDWEDSQCRLEKVKTIAEVSEKLRNFKREQVETGRTFEKISLQDKDRADKALIKDLRFIRQELIENGLEPEYAHALIGRSIFIRYLEDKKVLIQDYFREVAGSKAKWKKILDTEPAKPHADNETASRLYLRVLGDKNFTYALFERLATDFNGDMFPIDNREREAVTTKHLELIQEFLLGDPRHENLFFFAYKFNVIPIELISSIYEEFYKTKNDKKENNGTYYTPPALVEFVLSQVLTPKRLAENPRILDPACGSGIFLVQAFHRIVRYRMRSQNVRRLNDQQLRKILREQIAGIDINPEAVRVAAFSLYLALLHYLEPPDILFQMAKGRKLPFLKYDSKSDLDRKEKFNILLASNAFAIEAEIDSSHRDVLRKFSSGCADVVVGNPPWGSSSTTDNQGKIALKWCKERELSVGDREWSQAFIHRTSDLLRDGGCAGLLVSSGVLYKSHSPSNDFRKQWLTAVTLRSLVNFVHVRNIFFQGKERKSGGRSPFISVVFTKGQSFYNQQVFEYWSARKTRLIEGLQAVILNRADLKLVNQQKALRNNSLWKIYWWGSHRDEALINKLEMETPLHKILIRDNSLTKDNFGQGFKKAKKDKKPSGKLLKYKEFPADNFERYGPLDTNKLRPVPKEIHRFGNFELYQGNRLLLRKGIPSKQRHKQGRIIARLASSKFCFTNAINGVRLPEEAEWEAKILLGIFWSSLTRYYYWLTVGTWGTWYDEIRLKAFKRMPIRFPTETKLRNRIVGIVDKLRDKGLSEITKPNGYSPNQIVRLEHDLDEAIFDLYELYQDERDLVRDMCEIGLELFYKGPKSQALKPLQFAARDKRIGTIDDLSKSTSAVPEEMRDYLITFLQYWNRELEEEEGEFSWQIICPGGKFPMLAIVFATKSLKEPLPEIQKSDEVEWAAILNRLEKTSTVPFGSRQVYVEGLVRFVSDTEIIIIKRNERRLWTASMAREDAEATLLQAIHLQRANRK